MVCLTACTTVEPRFVAPAEALELAQVPFFPQEVHQCGPAALATVLNDAGVVTDPDALIPQVYIPGREGSLQIEMLAAVRRQGLVPYRLAATPDALLAELGSGRPVLLLQNLRLKSWPRWHYAVLIGYEPSRGRWLLRSGTQRRHSMTNREFMRTWALADHWAVVLARPATPPLTADAAGWIQAAMPFESQGHAEVAERAYRAAVQRWPESVLAWQALANAAYAQGQLQDAEQALRQALALQPSAATRNNLAQVLLERGCADAARSELDRITPVPAALAATVADTRRAIDAASSTAAGSCL